MDYEITHKGNELLITVSGRLDAQSAPRLQEALGLELASDAHVVFDLGEVEYISSAGLRVLLIAYKRVQKDGSLAFSRISPEVKDVLGSSGFAAVYGIE